MTTTSEIQKSAEKVATRTAGQETGTKTACPPWCTHNLGCREWDEYETHQQRIHELPLKQLSFALHPATIDAGPGELNVSFAVFADELYKGGLTPMAARLALGNVSTRTEDRASAVRAGGCHLATGRLSSSQTLSGRPRTSCAISRGRSDRPLGTAASSLPWGNCSV